MSQDYIEAVKWYRLAANQGYAAAQFNLGVMYAHGQGLPQNDAEALKWYRLAANQGYAAAQLNLGNMYANGRGVPKDYITAHMWLGLAMASGRQDAAKNQNVIAGIITRAQIGQAQKLTKEWKPAVAQ